MSAAVSAADLRARLQALTRLPAEELSGVRRDEARQCVETLCGALESGQVRAAEPASEGGAWRTNTWIKEGILLGFRLGLLADFEPAGSLSFCDKDIFPPRRWTAADGVRVVPGGTAVRRGAYVAPGVVLMPPAYVNVGAWVGSGTMIDSHALVGSCAQVGERVHLSAGAMLGGVLEPVGALPVIVEDDVFVGGNCGVYEGTQVGTRAVLGAGVVLARGSLVYDLPHGQIYRATPDTPLRIPPGAVVIPGVRRLEGAFAAAHGLAAAAPVIVKYRDDRTDAATALEDALR